MATALTMVTDALKEIGVLAEGQTMSAEMSDDALRALNRITESMANDGSFAYYASSVLRALTGESSFTIGPTGQVVATRIYRRAQDATGARYIRSNRSQDRDLKGQLERNACRVRRLASLLDGSRSP